MDVGQPRSDNSSPYMGREGDPSGSGCWRSEGGRADGMHSEVDGWIRMCDVHLEIVDLVGDFC